MPRSPKEFELVLNEEEAASLREPYGEGGHQVLMDDLRDQLQEGTLTIRLNDAELGKVVRYMTQYGSGGFQGRLKHALKRPLIALLSS